MWFKKKEKPKEFYEEKTDIIPVIPGYNLKDNIEYCNKCGCVVRDTYMKAVQEGTLFHTVMELPIPKVYYCTRCAPPYDRVLTILDKDNNEIKTYSNRVPEHYVAVTKEGKEIKNVPSKNKK